jgi:hypothetical protein
MAVAYPEAKIWRMVVMRSSATPPVRESLLVERCECGHPRAAHRRAYDGPKDPAGRKTACDPCAATIYEVVNPGTIGDPASMGAMIAYPCPCRDFKDAG